MMMMMMIDCLLKDVATTSIGPLSRAEIGLQSWQLGLSLDKTPRLGPSSPVVLCLSEFLSKVGIHLLSLRGIESSKIMQIVCPIQNIKSYRLSVLCCLELTHRPAGRPDR